jgi:outer membrane protein, heavy metal efflux system
MLRYSVYMLFSWFFIAASQGQESPKPPFKPDTAVTLSQIWSATLLGNPELAAFDLEVRAREAAALQAGLMPNPELGYTIEQFAGSGSFNGFNAAESTLQLSQLLQTGGKRGKNYRFADLGTELAQWDYQVKRREVLAAVSGAFAEVLALQEKLALSEQLIQLAEQTHQTMAARVAAGKAPLLEQTRSQVALSLVTLDQQRTRRSLTAARNRLAASWGGSADNFGNAQGEFYRRASLADHDSLIQRLEKNPDWARWETELQQRRAKLNLEKAKALPDVTVFAGIQNFQENPGTAMTVGFSVPLPLFDRNQGGIAEAHTRVRQGNFQAKNVQIQLKTALEQTYQALASADEQVSAFETAVIPAAEQVFQSAQQGYVEGKFSSLDVLDTQRTLFEARVQYIDTLLAYHQVSVEMAKLAGEPNIIADAAAAAVTGEKQ